MENITPDYVDEEIKQLLYNKGFRFSLEDVQIDGGRLRAAYSLAEQRWNEGNLSYIDDLTIAIVVKWLYLKHNIYINVQSIYENESHQNIAGFIWWIAPNLNPDSDEEDIVYTEPEQAYLEAIKYTLTKLI